MIVECPRPLLSLLASCAGIDRLVGRGDELPAFDVQAPLLSLPGIFHTALRRHTRDDPLPFRRPGPGQNTGGRNWAASPASRSALPGKGAPSIETIAIARFRWAVLSRLARLSRSPASEPAKGAGVEQLQEVADRFPVTELGSRLDDFMDTAAVMMKSGPGDHL